MYERLEGLGPSPRPVHLFVDLNKTEAGAVYGWHMFDYTTQTPIYVPDQALTGQLTKIHLKIKEFQNKQNYKIDFFVRAGQRNYVLRSGIETFFTRGVVLQLEKLDNLGDLPTITILAEPQDTTVRGSVWIGGEAIWGDWDPDVKLLPKIQELQKRLGQEPQTPESIQKDFNDSKQR